MPELAEVQSREQTDRQTDRVFCLSVRGRSDSAQRGGKGNALPPPNPTKATLALLHAVTAEEERGTARMKKKKCLDKVREEEGKKAQTTWKKNII